MLSPREALELRTLKTELNVIKGQLKKLKRKQNDICSVTLCARDNIADEYFIFNSDEVIEAITVSTLQVLENRYSFLIYEIDNIEEAQKNNEE